MHIHIVFSHFMDGFVNILLVKWCNTLKNRPQRNASLVYNIDCSVLLGINLCYDTFIQFILLTTCLPLHLQRRTLPEMWKVLLFNHLYEKGGECVLTASMYRWAMVTLPTDTVAFCVLSPFLLTHNFIYST